MNTFQRTPRVALAVSASLMLGLTATAMSAGAAKVAKKPATAKASKAAKPPAKAASTPAQTPIAAPDPAGPEWLRVINAYRASSGLGPVANDPGRQAGVDLHVKYLAATASFAHDEDRNNPLYTAAGAKTAQGSLLTGWQGLDRSDRQIIEDYMIGPFHAIHILEPRLQSVAFAALHNPPGAALTVAGVLDISGFGPKVTIDRPVVFPGNNATIPFTTASNEFPNPLTACPGFTDPVAFPLIAMFPTSPRNATATIQTNDGTNLDVCLVDTSYSNPDAAVQTVGRFLLDQKHAVFVIARKPFVAGTTYHAVVNGGPAGVADWHFTVGNPDAALPLASEPVVVQAFRK
jgi:Cysteine-rich secretory protein family